MEATGTRHIFFALIFGMSCAMSAKAGRVENAFAQSRDGNRPLLAIGSMDGCGPCRKLHHTLRNDSTLQPLLSQCVVLLMDVQSAEFANFANRFPADTSMVPMVYVVLPNGKPFYAKSGGLSGGQLSRLLREALSYSHTNSQPSRLDLAALDKVLETARVEARKGNLIQSLQVLDPMANMSGDAVPIRNAKTYQRKLIEAIHQWLYDLDEQMSSGDGIYGAAYRIAELYVELPEHQDIHRISGDLLRRYQGRTDTRNSVLQAKNLLKARFHEDRDHCERALENYGSVVSIDESTPSAGFARERIIVLQEKLNRKLTAQRSVN